MGVGAGDGRVGYFIFSGQFSAWEACGGGGGAFWFCPYFSYSQFTTRRRSSGDPSLSITSEAIFSI